MSPNSVLDGMDVWRESGVSRREGGSWLPPPVDPVGGHRKTRTEIAKSWSLRVSMTHMCEEWEARRGFNVWSENTVQVISKESSKKKEGRNKV